MNLREVVNDAVFSSFKVLLQNLAILQMSFGVGTVNYIAHS